MLKSKGNVDEIRYGNYTPGEYRRALNKSTFMVWLSQSESQGLALLEALSMDVPVLAWDPQKWSYYSRQLGRNFTYSASSSPYFSSKCGMKFLSIEDFEDKLNEFLDSQSSFTPRKFIIDENLIVGKTLDAFGLI